MGIEKNSNILIKTVMWMCTFTERIALIQADKLRSVCFEAAFLNSSFKDISMKEQQFSSGSVFKCHTFLQQTERGRL